MLYRASVEDVKSGRADRRKGYLVVAMRFYPRYVTRELIDEYCPELAPAPELFAEFKAEERASGDHDGAFERVEYEKRFAVSDAGIAKLGELSELAKTKSVFIICQCRATQKCHVDLLLLLAKQRFDASISRLRAKYNIVW